jgi:hypothetical protein
MNEITIYLSYLDGKQLAGLFHFIRNANMDSLSHPFVCGEASDVLDALIALVGKEDAKTEVQEHLDCRLSPDNINDLFFIPKQVTITAEQVDDMAQGKSVKTPWGWEEYRKAANGAWVLDHLLIPEPDFKRSHKVYLDGRKSEIIQWTQ